MNSASTISLTATMMLFARALSRTPRSSSHVMNMTIANAGTLIRIGMPPMCGAVCEQAVDLRVGAQQRGAIARREPVGHRDPVTDAAT